MEWKIKLKRVINNLDELGKIGRNAAGGIDRAFGEDTEVEARIFLKKYWGGKLGLEVHTDAAGNLWGFRKGGGEGAPIVFGSHHDAVKNGGAYDGALGVLLATEVMEVLIEHGVVTKRPFAIVSFTGEEPNPFGVSTLGSKVLSGRLTRGDLMKLRDSKSGKTLAEALKKVGGNAEQADAILLKKEDMYAFVECHIEQGKRLALAGHALACVGQITGIYREKVTVQGVANHSGTTIMPDRHDALLAASEFNLMLEKLLVEHSSGELTGTVGQFDIRPNSVNVIPCKAELIAEIRTPYKEVLDDILQKLDEQVEALSQRRGVQFVREVVLNQPCIEMDTHVQRAVAEGIREVGEPVTHLVSMAGHDAANIQRFIPSGMLFVRSPNGKSHCLDEMVYESDVEKAGNALLNTLFILNEEAEKE